MEFDIDKILDSMLNSMVGILALTPESQECLKKALAEEKTALTEIINARKDNTITDDEVKSQLDDEKLVLEAALLACKVEVGAKLQDAAEQAVNTFKKQLQGLL